jgi:hypothetical protein
MPEGRRVVEGGGLSRGPAVRWGSRFRIGVLLLLGGGLGAALLGSEAPPPPIVLVSGALGPGMEDSVPVPSPGVEWRGAPPSTGEEWAQVERAAAAGPLRAWSGWEAPPWVLDPPLRLRAGRVASLGVQGPDSPVEVEVVLEDPGGGVDTVRLAPGPGGELQGALPLRPQVSGWQGWRVRVGGPDEGELEWSGYVLPHRPLRIRVVSGPPTPEVRFALRALEERGEEVEGWIYLGQGLWTGRTGPLPSDPAAWAGWDVVLLFPGVPMPEPAARALLAASEGGMGLLLVGGAGGSILAGSGLAPGWDEVQRARVDTLDWSLPVALSPLPASDFEVEVARLAGEGHPWMRLGAQGRGRVGALGLAESWRWRLEGGMETEHRDWWEGWVSWLSDGLGPFPALEAEAGEARVGEPVQLRWIQDSPMEVAPRVRVRDPRSAGGVDAGRETDGEGGEGWITELTPLPLPVGPGWWMARGAVIPQGPGGIRVEAETDPDLGGLGDLGEGGEGVDAAGASVAVRTLHGEAPEPDPGLRLARLALSSPGGAVFSLAEGSPDAPFPFRGWPSALLLPGFLLLAALSGASWALHRLYER